MITTIKQNKNLHRDYWKRNNKIKVSVFRLSLIPTLESPATFTLYQGVWIPITLSCIRSFFIWYRSELQKHSSHIIVFGNPDVRNWNRLSSPNITKYFLIPRVNWFKKMVIHFDVFLNVWSQLRGRLNFVDSRTNIPKTEEQLPEVQDNSLPHDPRPRCASRSLSGTLMIPSSKSRVGRTAKCGLKAAYTFARNWIIKHTLAITRSASNSRSILQVYTTYKRHSECKPLDNGTLIWISSDEQSMTFNDVKMPQSALDKGTIQLRLVN